MGAGGQQTAALSVAVSLTRCVSWGKTVWLLRPPIFSSYSKVIKLENL